MIRKRPLGGTGMEVSAVSLGGVAFTWLDKTGSEKLINYCLDRGVNYLDVYAGTSEKIRGVIGERRSEFFLSTRGTAETLDDSLKNLNAGYFDIFFIGMVDDGSRFRSALKEARLLEKARKAGKFRFPGIATHNPSLYLKIIESGAFPVVMLPCNCVDEMDERVFEAAEKHGAGIVAMKPFAGGNLTNHGAGLRYILNRKVSTALIGMANPREARENIAVSEGNLSITANDRMYYEKTRRELGATFCRYCGHCIFPEPCPEDIPVRNLMMLETLAFQANMKRTVSGETLSSASRCRKCGACEKRCPYGLRIRELLPRKVSGYLKMTFPGRK